MLTHNPHSRTQALRWSVLVALGALTIVTGIGVLIALMSPESIKVAPTVTLVCVLALLSVPVPVLMLERNRAKKTNTANPHQPVSNITVTNKELITSSRIPSRGSIIHERHQSHESVHANHRSPRPHLERTKKSRDI